MFSIWNFEKVITSALLYRFRFSINQICNYAISSLISLSEITSYYRLIQWKEVKYNEKDFDCR